MRSIRARLFVVLLLAAIATAFLLGLITYRHTLQENEALFDYQLRQIALSLRDYGWIQPDLRNRRSEDELSVVIQIWTVGGNILYLSHPNNPVPDKATPGYADMAGPTRRWRVYSLIDGGRIIQVAQPIDLRRDLAAASALRSLIPLLAFVPIMAVLIWWLLGRALDPVKRLATDIGSRDERLLDEVSEQGVPSEITPLLKALNALLERLKKAFASQRAFVADAAHELRSPLTALKLQLDLLARARDVTERGRAMGQLNEGVERATRLVEQLLTAARMESGERNDALQPVDLAELVRQTLGEMFDFLQQRQIDFALDAPEHACIRADAAGLRILVRNLLDNAIRYTPETGAIRAYIAVDRNKTLLTLDDSGPGIPEEERARVFDRFYRGKNNEQSGSGLGLSIVKQIAERHGAELQLTSSPLGGLRVTVVFS